MAVQLHTCSYYISFYNYSKAENSHINEEIYENVGNWPLAGPLYGTSSWREDMETSTEDGVTDLAAEN
jgi:hypothetical protein